MNQHHFEIGSYFSITLNWMLKKKQDTRKNEESGGKDEGSVHDVSECGQK